MKHRVFLNTELAGCRFEDFHESYNFYIDDDGYLLVCTAPYGTDTLVARFPSGVWLYHRKVVIQDELEPLSKFLFFHPDGQYKIDTGRKIETTASQITYISEHGSKCDVGNWAVVFTFNEHGYQIVDINNGVHSKDLSYACILATDFVVAEIEKASGLKNG